MFVALAGTMAPDVSHAKPRDPRLHRAPVEIEFESNAAVFVRANHLFPRYRW
jgi:hypothetical protein